MKYWLLAAAALALALRLAGIGWGLPETYNSDEPHLLHLAVSFGGGSLRPYLFKYPTLWPYLLFAAYGAYFALWSVFGLRRSVAEFIGLYAWAPGGFYLIGRLLSLGFNLAGCWALWRAERELRPERWPWATLLLAFAPTLVEAGYAAKPDSLMFFWACLAWAAAWRVEARGARRDYRLCGLFAGLAFSSQFTAAPLICLLAAAHWLGRAKGKAVWVLEGLALWALGFLGGTPYALLDLPHFLDGLRDTAALASIGTRDQAAVFWQVLVNLWAFAGPGSAAGLAALLGLVLLARRRASSAWAVAAPVAATAVLVGLNPDGGWMRYLIACFPGLAWLAAESLSRLESRPRLAALAALLCLGPAVARSVIIGRELLRPDTRELSTRWIAEHVPEGSALLLDLPHASPRLAMEKSQVEALAQSTAAAGSPRARLYRGMAASHPGGGYKIYRIGRSAADLRSSPKHVELSRSETPSVDLGLGLRAARALGIGWVVTTSHGAQEDRSPELAAFFSELYREGSLEAVIGPEPGRAAGPVIRVFKLTKGTVPVVNLRKS